jgi:hypothetical protein
MVRPIINRRHRRKDSGADDDLAKDRGFLCAYGPTTARKCMPPKI